MSLASAVETVAPSPVHLRDLVRQAKEGQDFRRVLATGAHTQVVIMSIPPGGDIGAEVHPETDQVLWLVDGAGRVTLDGKAAEFSVGDVGLVTAGTLHNVETVGSAPMKLVTTYSPAHHPVGTVQATKPAG